MKMFIRGLGLMIARLIGSKIVDANNGRYLGRALLIAWKGRIHVIGLEAAVRPFFLPQSRMTYWKQTIAFTTHPAPDFPHIAVEKKS